MASYAEITVSGFDSSPPVDDGTVTEANRIAWATIKTKLGDPLNTAVGALDDAIAAAITTITSNQATVASTLATHTATYASVTGVLYAPAGTAALFVQTAAPTGWTKGATHNDKALRVVTGAVSTGGSTAFTSVFAARTITEANMPDHEHTWSSGTLSISFNRTSWMTNFDTDNSQSHATGGVSFVDDASDDGTSNMSPAGADAEGTTGETGGGVPMDFAVRYVDVIVATKD